MKKLFLILSLLVSNSAIVEAQDICSLFVEMPDSLMPLLTTNDRRDCIDFVDAKMRAVVTNRLDGKSEMTYLGDNLISLKSSGSTTMQMKLLPFNGNDTLICIVNTACAEACSSRIAFYDKKWGVVDGDGIFEYPRIIDFFHSSDSVERYINLADIYLVKLTFSESDDSLRAEYTMPSYMTADDSTRVAPMLRTISYGWNGKCFVNELKK